MGACSGKPEDAARASTCAQAEDAVAQIDFDKKLQMATPMNEDPNFLRNERKKRQPLLEALQKHSSTECFEEFARCCENRLMSPNFAIKIKTMFVMKECAVMADERCRPDLDQALLSACSETLKGLTTFKMTEEEAMNMHGTKPAVAIRRAATHLLQLLHASPAACAANHLSIRDTVYFKSWVMQTTKQLEECFRKGAERVIVAGIKGDLKIAYHTVNEWPEFLQLLKEGIEQGKIKGCKGTPATWEQIEEQRKDISRIDELTKAANGSTHVVIASCPEVYMQVVESQCGDNSQVHLSYSRAGDCNDLFCADNAGSSHPVVAAVQVTQSDPQQRAQPVPGSQPGTTQAVEDAAQLTQLDPQQRAQPVPSSQPGTTQAVEDAAQLTQLDPQQRAQPVPGSQLLQPTSIDELALERESTRELTEHLRSMGFRSSLGRLVQRLQENGYDCAADIDNAGPEELHNHAGLTPPELRKVQDFRNARNVGPRRTISERTAEAENMEPDVAADKAGPRVGAALRGGAMPVEAAEGSPEAILIAFYSKHQPEFASIERVTKITLKFQKKAQKKGVNWEEMMYAEMTKLRGEDPRALYKQVAAATQKAADEGVPPCSRA